MGGDSSMVSDTSNHLRDALIVNNHTYTCMYSFLDMQPVRACALLVHEGGLYIPLYRRGYVRAVLNCLKCCFEKLGDAGLQLLEAIRLVHSLAWALEATCCKCSPRAFLTLESLSL